MVDFKKVLYELQKIDEENGKKKYLEISVTYEDFNKALEDNGYTAEDFNRFLEEYGITEKVVVLSPCESSIHLFFYPEIMETDLFDNVLELAEALNSQVKEFFGVIQLDGDEPDAKNDYPYQNNDGMTSPEMKRRERQGEKRDDEKTSDGDDDNKKKKVKKVDKKKKSDDKENKKDDSNESTDAGDIPPEKVGNVADLMGVAAPYSIQKRRKKVLQQ